MTAANVRRAKQEALLRKPVNGTPTNGSVLGGNLAGSAVVPDDEDDDITNIHTNCMVEHQPQQQKQQPPTEREARQAFLAIQEAKMESVRRRREQTKAKRIAARITTTTAAASEQQFAHQMALAKQQWDALAARLHGAREEDESLGEIRRLLEIVLRNAATKSDPKYKLLNASNRNLWTRLLRFEEVVAILEEGAGFERRMVGTEKRKETEAVRIDMERDRINLKISQALDEASSSSGSNNPDAIASLVSDLEALGIAAARQQQPAAVCVEDDDDEGRDFALCHAGAGEDGLGVERILAILRAVETW